ncbi:MULTISPECIES: ABC transporter permease [Achromobacter]|jgi:ABC-type polysaccharide/polyol phosphate export permease|uniref:ABC transporter permease n=1 Tax=Achromobacter spanius TaxID=217203 RepID=A0AA42ISY3_9BURK|nr:MULTISPECIES: ABC transporter permease [Achromobacter]MCS3509459.1 ABC-type polysaccharide/polyol phosphate export permease [Achromobacter sp. JUb104]MDH0734619.1 ABC transporter permease [Achromobacter spanius]
MSNEDRIKGWRSRRKDSSYAVGSGVAAWRLDPAVLFEAKAPPAVLFKPLLARLQGEPHDSVAARRAVYEAVQAELDAEIARGKVDETVADFSRRRLRIIVRLLEQDIRAGVEVFAPGYMPAKLVAEDQRLADAHARRVERRKQDEARDARRHASRNDIALEVELPRDEAADLEILRQHLRVLHDGHHPRMAEYRPVGRTLLALFVFQLRVIHGESRIALLWALVGPVVLLTLISSLYILMGTHYILGMDVQTFSLLGATTWIMFRQIIFRSSAAYISARGILNFQGVTPLMCALVQSLIYLSIYLVVFAILISAGHALGFITLPISWGGFVLFVVLMGCCGSAMGLLFGSIATFWHFFLRLAPVIERFLQIFSGVFFVSEQLPEHLRPWILWSPFAHGMQLLRSAYFEAYESTDASLGYFLTSLVFLMVVALAAERLARPNIQPM